MARAGARSSRCARGRDAAPQFAIGRHEAVARDYNLKEKKVMFRNFLSWMLAGSMICALLCAPPIIAGSKVVNEARGAEKVKAGIGQLGVGEQARVRVRLRDGRKLEGYIKQAGDDFFVIADLKNSVTATVHYPDVTQVRGHRLSKGAKIAIVSLSIAVGVLAFFLWLENAD